MNTLPKFSDNQPNWVGAFPTTEHYSLRDYLDDLSNYRFRNPSRAIKKMLRDIISNINIKDLKLTGVFSFIHPHFCNLLEIVLAFLVFLSTCSLNRYPLVPRIERSVIAT